MMAKVTNFHICIFHLFFVISNSKTKFACRECFNLNDMFFVISNSKTKFACRECFNLNDMFTAYYNALKHSL